MPQRPTSFTVKYQGRANVLISDVHIATARTHLFKGEPTPEKLNAKKYIAIWDTGATGTVISQKVIDECNLKPIGMAKVHTANQDTTSPVYLASIFLPNKVVIPILRMVRGTIAGDAEVLVGMDVISHGDFAITNKEGKTAYSYRFPSCECIDFVEQGKANPVSVPTPKQIGRNDPCPCGSGKKYKKCCGR